MPPPTRRHTLLLPLLAAALLAACASPQPPLGDDPAAAPTAGQPPVVFVHGNGDSAATWTTTLWRWESNGWPRARLHAVHFPFPTARDDDRQPQPGRSSADEQASHLAAEVERVLAATGAVQVVLVGNSRGGNAIRHYVANFGGAAKVSHAILGGTPNHGVWASPLFRPHNEFNGAGPFLTALNAPKGPAGLEVTPGTHWLTLRSDGNDKFAQPDGRWIGAAALPTGVSADGPALRGATNRVLPGRDHREVSYHAEAFAATWRFVTGRAPATTAVVPEPAVVLDGQLDGWGPGGPTNRPLAGGRVTVWALDAASGERRGAPLADTVVAADGRWGPLTTTPTTPLEFVVQAPGQAVTHIYRAPFPRSSAVVHLRPERLPPPGAGALVSLSRPRGYFGLPRDTVLLDGAPAPGIPPGVAGVSTSQRRLDDGAPRAVVGEFRSGAVAERIVGRVWPASQGHVTVLELHD